MDLVGVGDLIQEIAQRAADAERRRGNFYRPAYRVRPTLKAKLSHKNAKPKRAPLKGVQLDLFPVAPAVEIIRDPQRPLFDLFPEAYQ